MENLGLENFDFVYRIKGNVNDCVIFHGGSNAYSTGFFSQVINGYLITVGGVFSPDNLGWYIFDGANIYTLKEAVDKSIFKMSDAADIVIANLLGDVTLDKRIDMTDVTELQKYLAGLSKLEDMNYPTHASDADQNGEVNMYDVVIIQRIIAKL
ncbi:MAG: dockerin type I repeat-containing protein [Clostridiales bacterium]|nr:dockerin type I repeat-containing protein [Clostridiales bacterium]